MAKTPKIIVSKVNTDSTGTNSMTAKDKKNKPETQNKKKVR